MKAEINNENKSKFFALYWGQRVVSWNNNKTGLGLVNSGYINDAGIYLEIKPLSSISDEDYNLLFGGDDKEQFLYQCGRGDIWYQWADFLRSKGYLLPWMGLSPEEIIKAGWAKYKE